MQKSCPYCTLPEIKKRCIIENALAWSFPTNIPIVPGHIIICPKRCVADIYQLTADEREALFDLMNKLKPALAEVFNAEGFNYAWNEGRVAGQEVSHIHLQLLPRKAGDTGVHQYDPREFLYRTGKVPEQLEEALQKIALTIRSHARD